MTDNISAIEQTPDAALRITAQTIAEAAVRIAPHTIKTPLMESPLLNNLLGIRLLVKAECLQHTGAFKLRGASNVIWSLDDNVKHVVAYSSGNHAQGVARAAASRGIKATIVMPEDAPVNKVEGTRAFGAEVVYYDRYSESREDIGEAITKKYDAALVRPYEDVRIIAGQGTVGHEIAAQCVAMNITPDALLCCCGGGGLIAGTSIAMKSSFPDIDIWSAEPVNYDDTKRSLESGAIQTADISKKSICDAIVTPQPGEMTFAINRKNLTGGAVVSDELALRAIATAFKYLKIIIEPGGAVALAAALDGQYPAGAKTVIAVASGGNIDNQIFARALDAGALI
ncbi:threonine/serine dehydratase [uncultured Candidatus Puniceispirillum sp.]|uniref:threonine ammonia-lyase n=1 Tax=uncultured Candidatus Puniceispirillum sp. TaxID=1985115 RepID=UPI0032B208DB